MGSILKRPATVFGLASLFYLCAGVLLTGRGFYLGDSLSRLQSAQSVLFSRSPALVDIGFVFTPLNTLCELPLVALDHWIPAMTDRALAAVTVSALFTAGAVLQVWLTGTDRGLRTPYLVAVTLLFALNPMVVIYAGTGMSEGPFLFAMAWAVRRLMRFLRTDDVHDLMAAGIAVALGFLARYDALVAAAAGAVLVAVITFTRRDTGPGAGAGAGALPSPRHRLGRAVTDTVVFLFPVTVAALVWFATSWLTTGILSAQVNGSYGNASILESSGGSISGMPAARDWSSEPPAARPGPAGARSGGARARCPPTVRGQYRAVPAVRRDPRVPGAFRGHRFHFRTAPLLPGRGFIRHRARAHGADAPGRTPRTTSRSRSATPGYRGCTGPTGGDGCREPDAAGGGCGVNHGGDDLAGVGTAGVRVGGGDTPGVPHGRR
ncbi:hypothetical protein CVAR21S_00649 [Corynebacterium variabile]